MSRLLSELQFSSLDSAIGTNLVVCRASVACAIEFAPYQDRMLTRLRARFPDFRRVETPNPGGVCSKLRAYLEGQLDAVDDIVIDAGGTPFQRKVWAELRRIRPGAVVTYSGLAQRLSIPNAVRAVGHANASNPIESAGAAWLEDSRKNRPIDTDSR